MTQAQQVARESVEITFKRFILQELRDFEKTPQADLFRVNLLGQMLDRYDELRAKGMEEELASARVKREYYDIAQQMRDMGFEEMTAEDAYGASLWPQMTEDEAAQYIKESDAYLHKRALGIAMCTSCVFPMIVAGGIAECVYSWQLEEALGMVGLVGMFAMIAVGVYSMVMAKKPKREELVKRGRFSLRNRVRKKLMQLQEAVAEKARRRRGKGIALLVGCVTPIFIGAALDALVTFGGFELCSVLGVAGMFVMIGAGVYELVMADGEKKTMKKLLNNKEK